MSATDRDQTLTTPMTRRRVVAIGAKLAYATPLVVATVRLAAGGAAAISGDPGAVGAGAAPALAADVRQPINADGSSVFRANRGVVPVKFGLSADGAPTCALPAATIAVARLGGPAPVPINESVYTSPADGGSAFRVEGCQYGYNLAATALGRGAYQVEVLIGGVVRGSASFALR